MVGLFEPAQADKVGTVAEQDAYYQRWIDARKSRAENVLG
jgi:hypothetical protein